MIKPSIDAQVAANLRTMALRAMVNRFGSDRATWPAEKRAEAQRLERQHADYLATFSVFLGNSANDTPM